MREQRRRISPRTFYFSYLGALAEYALLVIPFFVISSLSSAQTKSDGALQTIDTQQRHLQVSAEKLPPDAVSGPRQLFRALGVSDCTFDELAVNSHGENLDREALLRVLFRLPDFPEVNLAQWAQHKRPGQDNFWKTVADDPSNNSGKFYAVRGQVLRVTPRHAIDQPDDLQSQLDIDAYYECQVQLDGESNPVTVYALSVPRRWSLDESVNYRTSFFGCFLTADATPRLFFAAKRLAWHPDTHLGQLGMDYGQFDFVQNGAAIRDVEGEGFYQMLAAVGKDAPGSKRIHPDNSSLASLLKQPDTRHGERVSFRGTARRAIPIKISDDATAQRFGFNHYYEIDVFVDLGQIVSFSGQKLSTYPFTVCVRQLPEGMPVGEKIGHPIDVTGFFYKLWSYRSTISNEANKRQPSPLIIAREPTLVEPAASEPHGFATLAAGVVALAILGIALGLYFSWQPTSIAGVRTSRTADLPENVSFEDLTDVRPKDERTDQ